MKSNQQSLDLDALSCVCSDAIRLMLTNDESLTEQEIDKMFQDSQLILQALTEIISDEAGKPRNLLEEK